ncbi:MAG: alpha/beta hydrolase [Sedimentisphaeraceae bacterium JB056]
MKPNFENINSNLPLITEATPNVFTENSEAYLEFYNLNTSNQNIEHSFGVFESHGLRLAAHIYKPQNYKATYFVLHGYLDHCGMLSKLIGELLKNNFAVATFDLPGHGISEGEKCEIENFIQYADALSDFLRTTKPILNSPYNFIGHSTGASAMMELLLSKREIDFERIILAAPLIRCAQWKKSRLGYTFEIPFIKSVPRMFRKNSSDEAFLSFIKDNDPLQTRFVPLSWVSALHKWNDRIETLPASLQRVEILQGCCDKIVDWQYNMMFIQRKFPHAEINIIENANHELFNESKKIRKDVFRLVIGEKKGVHRKMLAV